MTLAAALAFTALGAVAGAFAMWRACWHVYRRELDRVGDEYLAEVKRLSDRYVEQVKAEHAACVAQINHLLKTEPRRIREFYLLPNGETIVGRKKPPE